MKRKIIIISISLVLIFFLTVLGIYHKFDYVNHHKEYFISSEISPNGNYKIEFYQIGKPAFFDSARVKVKLIDIKSNKILEEINASSHNDGAGFCAELYEIVWYETYSEITIKSVESSDVKYTVSLGD